MSTPDNPPLTRIPASPNYPSDAVSAAILPPDKTFYNHLPPLLTVDGNLSGRKCFVQGLHHLSKAGIALTLFSLCSKVFSFIFQSPNVPTISRTFLGHPINLTTPFQLTLETPVLIVCACLVTSFVAFFFTEKRLWKNQVPYFNYLEQLFHKHLEKQELKAAEEVFQVIDPYCGQHTIGYKDTLHTELLNAYLVRNVENPDENTLRILLNRIAERLSFPHQNTPLLTTIQTLFEKIEKTFEVSPQRLIVIETSLPKTLSADITAMVCNYLGMRPVSLLIPLLIPRWNDALLTDIETERLRPLDPNQPLAEPCYLLRAADKERQRQGLPEIVPVQIVPKRYLDSDDEVSTDFEDN